MEIVGLVSISIRPHNDNVNLGLNPDFLQNTDTKEVTVDLNTTKEHESTQQTMNRLVLS